MFALVEKTITALININFCNFISISFSSRSMVTEISLSFDRLSGCLKMAITKRVRITGNARILGAIENKITI